MRRSPTQILAAIREGIAARAAPRRDAKPILACVMADAGTAAAARRRRRDHPDLRVSGERRARARRRSPPTRAGARSRRACSGASTTCASTRRGRSAGGARPARRRLAHRRGDAARAARVRLAAGGWAPSRARPTRRRRWRAVLGFPVVAKLASRRCCTRRDIGAVRLNLPTRRRRSGSAFARHPRARAGAASARRDVDGVLIQPMVTGGVETIVGVTARSACSARWSGSGSAARTWKFSATCDSASRR